MQRLPRIAVGTIQPAADLQTMLWALMEALRQAGLQVQSFLSRACFPECRGLAAVSGLPPRHLDSWLMSPETCREIFLRGSREADLALVYGEYDPAIGGEDAGGRLETLCRWLNLPRLVVLDAPQLERCGVPERPRSVEGVLLDRVAHSGHFARLATDVEALWGVPVLGALEELPQLRSRLADLARGQRAWQRLCGRLGDELARYWQPDRLWQLAAGRAFPQTAGPAATSGPACAKLTVAIAFDEAFHCYFPDTLDLLELRGASLVDFSPLRDESLPAGTDLVYLGCGHPERYAAALAENHCMKASLRSHLAAGRRIYAEGGGAAYLCEQMETPSGEMKRMVGVFPATARWNRSPATATPVEVTLGQPSWLGGSQTRLRGYRNGRWHVQASGPLTGFVVEEQHRHALMGSFQAIGSMVHLDFAARPALVDRFFYPQSPRASLRDPWAVVV